MDPFVVPTMAHPPQAPEQLAEALFRSLPGQFQEQFHDWSISIWPWLVVIDRTLQTDSATSAPLTVIYGDASQEAITKLTALLDLQKDTFPTQKELEAPRLAIWKSKDHDQPVTVTGEMGEKDGRRFYAVKETSTGIPEDELEFQDAKAKGAA